MYAHTGEGVIVCIVFVCVVCLCACMNVPVECGRTERASVWIYFFLVCVDGVWVCVCYLRALPSSAFLCLVVCLHGVCV